MTYSLQDEKQEKWHLIKIVMLIPLFIFSVVLSMVIYFKYTFINECSERFINIQYDQCVKLVDYTWNQSLITLMFGLLFSIGMLIILRITIFRGLNK